VDLDEAGNVILNGKGMSVAPAWRCLPYFLVPRRLKNLFPGARSAADTYCFTMGEGLFQDGPVAAGLDLRQDAPPHGNIVPQQLVLLESFQADLGATRKSWTIDET